MNENNPETNEEPYQTEQPAAHENEGADVMSPPENEQAEQLPAHSDEGADSETPSQNEEPYQEPAHVGEGADIVERVPEPAHDNEGADSELPPPTTTTQAESPVVVEAQAEETTSTTAIEPAHPGEGPDVVEAPEATTTTTAESPTTTEAVVSVPSQEKPELAETGSDVGGGLLVGSALVLAGIAASAKRFFKNRKTPQS